MPTSETVEAFVAIVTAGHFAEAIERFYAEDPTAQENANPPRIGRKALIGHEPKTLANFDEVRAGLLNLPSLMATAS